MADQFGSTIRSGQVALPALFQGTARLLDGTEAPPAPKPARHDDLEGQFQADLPLTFALLHSVGFAPVPPSHPAYSAYLEASRQHASAPNDPPSAPPSPHGPDTIVMPFETTITITEEMALQFGLVAPGHGASRSNHQAQPAARKRKAAVPPPYFNPKAGSTRSTAPAGADDLDAFLRFVGAPKRASPMTSRTGQNPALPLHGIDLNIQDIATPHQAADPAQPTTQTPRSAHDPSVTGTPASTLLHGLSVAGRFTSSAAIGAASSLKQTAVGTWTLINKGDTYLNHALLYGPHDPVVAQTNAEVADIGSRVGSAIKTAAEHPLDTIKTAAQTVESGAEKLVADGEAAETAGTLPEFLGGLTGEAVAQLLTLPAEEVRAAELAADAVRGAETIGAKEGLGTTEKAATGEAGAQTALRDVHFTTAEEFNKAAANPLPNTTYHYGTYSWTTDEHARTKQIHGFVEVKSAGRNETLQIKIGKEGKPGDVGFHLLADSLNGPTNPLNVVPGNGKPIGDGLANLNQGAYARLERTIRKMATGLGHPVEIRITPQYTAGNLSKRPDTILVEFRPGTEDWSERVFSNK